MDIEKWQTAAASFVGFSGVITTLIVNAWLTRKSDLRKQSQETKSLRAALRVEMTFIRDGLVDNLNDETGNKKEAGWDILIGETNVNDVYKSNVGKIGLLREDEVAAILHAYFAVQGISRTLRNWNKSGDPAHIVIDARQHKLVASVYKSAITPLNKAIVSLGGKERAVKPGSSDNKKS